MSRSVARVAVALAVLVSVTGCITLSHQSGVNEGRGVRVHDRPNLIDFTPPPPRPGANKSDIVSGYLLAMLGYPQSPSVVREYLTPAARQHWQPDALLVVYQDTDIRPRAGGKVHLTAEKLGTIDRRGSWVSSSPSDDELVTDLDLVRVHGQWRISDPPIGTLLDADYFGRYYHQYSLYYFDPRFKVLAPDPVYQLLGGVSRVATDLVSNLLLGPTPEMDGVVTGVVPTTTGLSPGVTVSKSGIADVHLTANVATLPRVELVRFATQLSWTLRQERLGISRFRIMVGHRVIVVPGLGESIPTVDAFLSFDPSGISASANLYAISRGKLMTVVPTGPSAGAYRVVGPIGSLAEKANSAAVAVDGLRAALVVDGRTKVEVGAITAGATVEGASEWFGGGSYLLKPSWDARKVLWLVDRTPSGAVVRVASGARVRVVDAPGVAGQQVRAFAVSRDGMRFAAIIGHGASSRLVIAMIHRSASARLRVSLTGVLTVANAAFPFVNLTSLAWYNPTTLAVLAQVEGSEPQPYQIAIDGSRVEPTTGFLPVLPVSLTAGADPSIPPVIGTGEGQLYVRGANQQWTLVPAADEDVPIELRHPTYPG